MKKKPAADQAEPEVVKFNSSGLVIGRERLRGDDCQCALSWYGEPLGRIYRHPDNLTRWLGEFWDGRQKVTVWEPMTKDAAAVATLSKWSQACKVDLLEARKTNT
jgi:hypothetical protein